MLLKLEGSDKAIAELIHALVLETAPELWPKTWYGMPAYAKDGKVLRYSISRTILRLVFIFVRIFFGSIETYSVKKDLSTVISCEKLITEDFSRPESDFSKSIFAGDFVKFVFDVITAQIIVLIAL